MIEPPTQQATPAFDGLAFCKEYLRMTTQETDAERKLLQLAEEYRLRTEAYDRIVCTGPIKHGAIMPATGLEASQINQHAIGVRYALEAEAAKLGFTPQQVHDAIRRVDNSSNSHRERPARQF